MGSERRLRLVPALAPAHVEGDCDLAPGASWQECDCADIDPADRPCVVCEALAESAEKCAGCKHEQARRG